MAGILAALLLAAVPAAAQAAPGALDRGFGIGGRAIVRTAPAPASAQLDDPRRGGQREIWTASAPGNKLVALGRGQLFQFSANGRPDQSFGTGGRVDVVAEAGHAFQPVGVAVDSQGRILVAGTTELLTEDWATVYRYLPTGALDPSWGEGGVLSTDFGFEAPSEVRVDGSDRSAPSAVIVTAMAVTTDGRLVLAGSYVRAIGSCRLGRAWALRGYVARLDSTGALDASFGQGGLSFEAQANPGPILMAADSKQVFFWGLPETALALLHPRACSADEGGPATNTTLLDLLPDGHLNAGFGAGGGQPLPSSNVIDLAADGKGRLLVLGTLLNEHEEFRMRIQRLLPSGLPDPSFGERNGSVWPHIAGQVANAQVGDLAVDGRGRVLLASAFPRSAPGGFSFLLTRFGTLGRVDRGFGREGLVTTPFGAGAFAMATQVSLDERGRIVLGGTISRSKHVPGGAGFSFARYLGGGR